LGRWAISNSLGYCIGLVFKINMSIKVDNIIISEDDSLELVKGFSTLKSTLASLHRSGVLSRMSGNCIGATDIVGNMLYQKGIKSYVTECHANIDSSEFGATLIGYENFLAEGSTNQLDTHTVLIVLLDDCQLLVDCSIQYALPPYHPIIVERVNGTAPDVLAEFKLSEFSILYSSKKSVKLPNIHQSNLISNLLNEAKNGKRIEKMNTALMVAIGLGLINLVLNLIIMAIKIFT